MRDGTTLPWPRFLRDKKAAAYLDISKTHFLTIVAPELHPIQLSPGVKGWLREDLDAWLDARAGREAASPVSNPWHPST
jgi:predicted DNA-binding transcriptional regulator AlpA